MNANYTKCMQQKDPDCHDQKAKVYNETREGINIRDLAYIPEYMHTHIHMYVCTYIVLNKQE